MTILGLKAHPSPAGLNLKSQKSSFLAHRTAPKKSVKSQASLLDREVAQSSYVEFLEAGAVDKEKFRAYTEATQQLNALANCRSELLQFLEDVTLDIQPEPAVEEVRNKPSVESDADKEARKAKRAVNRAQRNSKAVAALASTTTLAPPALAAVPAPAVSVPRTKTAQSPLPVMDDPLPSSATTQDTFTWRRPGQTSSAPAGPLSAANRANAPSISQSFASTRSSLYKQKRVVAPIAPIKNIGSKQSTDGTTQLLRNIAAVDLLTAEEEKSLACVVQDLVFIERVKAELTGLLSREPTTAEWAEALNMRNSIDLERRCHVGVAAKSKMFEANHRLVVSICKKYLNRGSSLQDLICEGLQGLLKGIEKFDSTKGFRFSTYAHWWIRQAITRSLSDQSRIIRLPVHMYEQITKVKKMRGELRSKLNREPTHDEMAEATGTTPERLKELFRMLAPPQSMDAPVGDSEGMTMGDLIEDEDQVTPEEQLEMDMSKRDMDKVLSMLTERERTVISLRYGLGESGQEATLEEIGKVVGVTRERIRQIEAKALCKLRTMHQQKNGSSELEEMAGGRQEQIFAARTSKGMKKSSG